MTEHANLITRVGQPMEITYDTARPPVQRRVVSAPTSLLNRVQKPALADRLSKDDTATTKKRPACVLPLHLLPEIRLAGFFGHC
jgi:hypothetical protein